ncbi:MAG: hypothetical protein F4Y12_02860 [Acidimicrobiaceae bacterium]|nr:hypothetical protein [Acidimicrobiaceae bacterium]MYH77567.1 hypothetical protein [Acidimicrobiaceae bacterium]MYK77363.1 hypothetical protein [Acidimicrobiaceae bacterium]
MAQAPDSTPDLQAQATMSTGGTKLTRPRLRDEIAENPLLCLFLGLTLAIGAFFLIAVSAILLAFLLTSA